ncbi:MAG: hypothetical protein IJU79_06265 [Desulfovibrionaceae bacterium]|nr:hypothetical protein [Desulfovibrionaceae bacterium]
MYNKSEPSPYFGWIFGLALIVMGGWWIWANFSTHITLFVLQFADLQLTFLHLPKPIWLEEVLLKGSQHDIDFQVVWAVLDYAGRPYAVCTALFAFCLSIYAVGASTKEQYCRHLDMDGLLKHNEHFYPCVAPIVNWGRSLLAEPLDTGPWRLARTPLQFAYEHNLLNEATSNNPVERELVLTKAGFPNMYSPILTGQIKIQYNRTLATLIFEAQLGPRWEGFDKLPAYLQALSLAFILFGLGQKKQAQEILARLAISFRPPQAAQKLSFKRTYPFILLPQAAREYYAIDANVPFTSTQIKELWQEPKVQATIKAHNKYRNLLLLALYGFARTQGVLATPEFIWLKVINRPLFYLCNNYGRRTCWVEVAGAWTHYQAEIELAKIVSNFSGDMLQKKEVQSAVDALEDALIEQGWLSLQKSENNKQKTT